jgi:hypothetical protein
MSVQSVQILEGNFADFVKDQNGKDYFLKKIKELYAQLSDPTVSMSDTKKKEIEELLAFLDTPENLDILLNFSKKFISLKNNKNQPRNVFDNLLPYGSNDHVLDFLTLESANISSDKFVELGTRLFPDTFSKERLKHGFMTLFLFPTINIESFGLHNVELLRTLFDNFFINNILTNSFLTIKDFIDKYFTSEEIFKIKDLKPFIPKIKGYQDRVFSGNEFFKFDCKLWYESFDEKISNSNKSKIAVLLDRNSNNDSYGQFVSLPDLKDGKPNILGTYGRKESTYELTLLPNMRKRCFVIPKMSILKGTEEKLFTRPNNLANPAEYVENLGFLLFYNFIKFATQEIIIREDTTTKEKKISSTMQLYKEIPSRMAGGSKKNKMIGGSRENLFDKKSEPFLLLKREKYVYDKKNFYECLQKLRTYKLSEFKNQIQIFLETIYSVNTLNIPILFPVVYSQGENLSLGTFGLAYEQLRLIFHFSYVYTTFIKLLLFFFRNLIKIYQTFVFYFESQIKTDNKSKPLYEQKIQFYEENIKKFSILNSEIAKLIQILELTISCEEDPTNNFFGFNTTFYKKFIKNSENANQVSKAKQMQINFIDSIIDLLFEGFTLTSLKENGSDLKISIKPNQFMKLLQKLSGIFPINFGGVPLIDLPKTQNSFLVSYSYFIRFRYVCQRNFSQFKKFYNIAEKQKLTNKEIKNISNDVNAEVRKIVSNRITNLKDKCKKIFKNVLEKFMDTIIDIQPKNQSASGSSSVHNNTTTNEQTLSTKVTEFKVYIAIMEKILDNLIKAELEAAKSSSKRLFIDPKTLFLFMMGRFNNFIYILEYCLLNIDAINSTFSMFLQKASLDRIYKDFEILFFNTKPVYPSSLEKISANTVNYITNPLNSNPNWWLEKEVEFKKTYGESSRLFMLCIRKNGIGSDLVLVDPFSCSLTPSGEKILQKKFLDLSYTYDGSGRGKKIVDMQYSPSNNAIINLTPSLRQIRQLWSRFKTKNITKKNISSSNITNDFFRQVLNKVPNSVSTNTSTRNDPITTMKNVVRLLKGLLKDEFGRNIKPVILQGRNQSQLLQIIARNMLQQKNDIKDNEYQLIQFSSSDFENSDNFRRTLSKVLFSPPQTCFDEKSALELNLFNLYQKPVSSKTFLNKIKLGELGLGGLVKDFFSAIEPATISDIRAQLNLELRQSSSSDAKRILIVEAAKKILETSRNLTHQQKLQELLIQKESKFYAIKNKNVPVSQENSQRNKRLDFSENELRKSINSAAGVFNPTSSFSRRQSLGNSRFFTNSSVRSTSGNNFSQYESNGYSSEPLPPRRRYGSNPVEISAKRLARSNRTTQSKESALEGVILGAPFFKKLDEFCKKNYGSVNTSGKLEIIENPFKETDIIDISEVKYVVVATFKNKGSDFVFAIYYNIREKSFCFADFTDSNKTIQKIVPNTGKNGQVYYYESKPITHEDYTYYFDEGEKNKYHYFIRRSKNRQQDYLLFYRGTFDFYNINDS